MTGIGAAAGTQLRLDDRGQPLVDTTFVVLDLETTGTSPDGDRITEVGAVRVRGGLVEGTFATLVDPGRPIPAQVTALTGISDRDVAGHPRIDQVLPSLRSFLGDAVLVAHSARFDVGFLNASLQRHGHAVLACDVVDTVALARRLVGEEVRNLRLATLARHLRARTAPTHRALADARATVDVLHALLERAGNLGATTLPDLLDLCSATSMPAFRRIGLVADAPRAPGVYRFLADDGRVLYVGKATDLRSRLRTYFGRDPRRRMAEMVRLTDRVTWVQTSTVLEAEVRELRDIRRWQPPYNRRSRSPAVAWLALSREPFPRVLVTSGASASDPDDRRLLGPMARRTATELATALNDVGDLRECRTRLRARQDHPACILADLGRCRAPCDGSESRTAYLERVEQLRRDLRDDPSTLLARLGDRMRDASARRRFEQAAWWRDQQAALAMALERGHRLQALVSAGRVVAAASTSGGWDVVVVDGGRLVTSEHQPARPGVDGPVVPAVLPPAAAEAVLSAEAIEEAERILAFLRADGTRLLWAEEGLALPLAGAAEAADVVGRAGRRRRERAQAAKVAA